MSQKLIDIIRTLGVKIEYIQGESSRNFNDRMNRYCPEKYEEAKSMIKPSESQLTLCNDLIDCGAGFDLKCSHENSMASADAFIKVNYYLLKNPTPDSVRAGKPKPKNILGVTGRLGGVGSERHEDFYKRVVPSDYCIPNH